MPTQGCAAVLREALTSRYPTFPPPFPSAALIKALLVNGADILEPTASNFVPSNESGHGRVNIANAIAVVHGEPGTDFHEDKLIGPTSEWLKKIDVKPGYTTLKATLVWLDPPDEEIKNRLLLGARVAKMQKRALNKDNVQQVVWSPIPDGEVTLKVSVIARKLAVSPQPFAIVWRLY